MKTHVVAVMLVAFVALAGVTFAQDTVILNAGTTVKGELTKCDGFALTLKKANGTETPVTYSMVKTVEYGQHEAGFYKAVTTAAALANNGVLAYETANHALAQKNDEFGAIVNDEKAKAAYKQRSGLLPKYTEAEDAYKKAKGKYDEEAKKLAAIKSEIAKIQDLTNPNRPVNHNVPTPDYTERLNQLGTAGYEQEPKVADAKAVLDKTTKTRDDVKKQLDAADKQVDEVMHQLVLDAGFKTVEWPVAAAAK